MKKNIHLLLGDIQASLAPLYSNQPEILEQYSWWTLQAITKKSKATLIAENEIELSEQENKQLASWLDRMVNEDEPIQYLLGNVPFGDIEILVEPPILIPRPETEQWTYWLIDQLKKIKQTNFTILDLCSGTGCIALALAHAFPNAKIYATDINPQAIALARKNAQHNKISNIEFIQGDLFTEHLSPTLFDLIVSNPPYISFDEFTQMDDSVTEWEDKQALVAQDEGHAIIDDIIEQAPDYIKPNQELAKLNIPQLVIEIGFTQGHWVSSFMRDAGFVDVEVHKDLEGKDRWVTGRVGNVVTPFMAE